MIYVDVTHTYSYPYNTGVQRVVRKLAGEASQNENCTLVRFESRQKVFVALKKTEIAHLLEGWRSDLKGDVDSRDNKTGSLYGRLVLLLKGTPLYRPIAWVKDSITHHWISPVMSFLNFRKNRYERVDFRGGTYLTAEVFGEPDRIGCLKRVLKDSTTSAIFIVHDLIPYTNPELSIMKAKHFNNYLKLIPLASLLIVDSDSTQKAVEAFFISKRLSKNPQIRRIYPGCDILRSTSIPVSTRLKDLRFFFTCVGTIEVRKNQVLLLEVLEELWSLGHVFSFVFVGNLAETPSGFEEKFHSLVSKGYDLRWIRYASDEEIVWLYQNAIASVYPSLIEGYGLPIVESVAYGTPCVASSRSSTGEIAQYLGGCDIVDPTDRKAIGCALQMLLTDGNRRKQLKETIDLSRISTWKQYSDQVLGIAELY